MANSRSNIYVLAPLFLVLIIDTMCVGLIFPILGPLFTNKVAGMLPAAVTVGVRDIFYGLTLAVASVFMFIGAPILGDLSDHLGRKKVLLICLGGTALGLGLSALAVDMKSIWLLILSRAIAGFMSGSDGIAQAAIIDISSPKSKAINLSMMTLANSLGFVMGPMVSGVLADSTTVSWFDYSTPFIAAAILAFFNAGLLIYTFRETFRPSTTQRVKLTRGLSVFASAFTNRKVRNLALIFLLMQIGWALYFQYLSLYLVKLFDYQPRQIGHIMAWLGLIFGISLVAIVRVVVNRFSLEKITFYSLMLIVVGILSALVRTDLMQWIAVVPTTIGVALSYMALLTLFSNAVDKDQQGWVMGVTAAVVGAAWTIGALLAGVVGMLGVSAPMN